MENIYKEYKKMSLIELENLVSNAKSDDERDFYGMILNFFLKENITKAIDEERY